MVNMGSLYVPQTQTQYAPQQQSSVYRGGTSSGYPSFRTSSISAVPAPPTLSSFSFDGGGGSGLSFQPPSSPTSYVASPSGGAVGALNQPGSYGVVDPQLAMERFGTGEQVSRAVLERDRAQLGARNEWEIRNMSRSTPAMQSYQRIGDQYAQGISDILGRGLATEVAWNASNAAAREARDFAARQARESEQRQLGYQNTANKNALALAVYQAGLQQWGANQQNQSAQDRMQNELSLARYNQGQQAAEQPPPSGGGGSLQFLGGRPGASIIGADRAAGQVRNMQNPGVFFGGQGRQAGIGQPQPAAGGGAMAGFMPPSAGEGTGPTQASRLIWGSGSGPNQAAQSAPSMTQREAVQMAMQQGTFNFPAFEYWARVDPEGTQRLLNNPRDFTPSY